MHDLLNRALEQNPLFQGLTPEVVAEISRAALRKQLPRGTRLVKQDARADFVTLILKGAFKLTAHVDTGVPITLKIAQAGEVIGDVNALTRIPYSIAATAVAPSESLFWSATRFEHFARSYPQLVVNCITLAIRRERLMLRRICASLTEKVERRIARSLFDLTTGVTAGSTDRLYARGQDIAELSDTTIYTVSRVLSQWKRSAIVSGHRGRITILDSRRLHQIIDGSIERSAGRSGRSLQARQTIS